MTASMIAAAFSFSLYIGIITTLSLIVVGWLNLVFTTKVMIFSYTR